MDPQWVGTTIATTRVVASRTFSRLPIASSALTVLATSETGVWAGGQLWGYGSLWFSPDGQNFVRKSVPDLYTWVLNGILPTRDGELLAAGEQGIVRSANGGESWQEDGFGAGVWALHRAPDDTIWAGGFNAVYRSLDDGKSWSTFAPTTKPIYCFVDTPNGLIALGERAFWIASNALEELITCPPRVMAASKAPNGTIVAVGKAGLVAISQDGINWNTLPPASHADLSSVAYCGDRFYIGGIDPDDFDAGQNHALFELRGETLTPIAYRGGQTEFNAWTHFRGRTFLAVYDKSVRHSAHETKGYLLTTGPVRRGSSPRLSRSG